MANDENINNENKSAEKYCDTFCFCGQGMPEVMAKFCEGMRGPHDSRSMMTGCMKMCRWFPLIAVVVGVTFLSLGYYLDASIIRVLWMLFAGFVVIMGAFGLILMGSMKKIYC
jgi:hypothetical protein